MKKLARFVFPSLRRQTPVEPSGPPRLLLFDFDGTIADTFESAFIILNKLAAEFGFRGLERSDLETARAMRTRQLMKFLKIPATKMSRIARRGSQELRAMINDVQPLPGMKELVLDLKRQGYSLGIVTSNTQENVATFLRNHDMEVFDFVRSSSKLLGKAREIRVAIKQGGVPKNEVLYVGDETRDIEACQSVGIRIAAVTWGYNSLDSIEKMKPEYVIQKPDELAALLAK